MGRVDERWKPIPGFDNYEVSNLGRVRSIRARFNKPGKILSPKDNGRGYLSVCLCSRREQQYVYIHRLVLRAFVGTKNLDCNHIDGKKGNNALSNLEYVTRKENMEHAVSLGLMPFGEDDPKALLSNKEIIEMRRLHKIFYANLAEKYGVKITTVKEILAYRKRKKG